MEWQPIETVDRKELVILFIPERRHGPTGRDYKNSFITVGRVYEYPYRQPTHWMPLPAPPPNA